MAERLAGTGAPAGAAVLTGADGRPHLHLHGPVTADSVFTWASVTKTVTGTLLALLAQDGTVELEQPLGSLLPGAPPLPLADLASHTSGLPRLLPSSLRYVLSHPKRDPYAEEDEARVLAALARTRLRSPGRVRYSNAGAGLLGLALSRAAGTTYAELVRTRVAEPLGLTSLTTTDTSALVTGHDRRGRPVSHWGFADAMAGCGVLRGTATDLATWITVAGRPATPPEPLAGALRLAATGRARNALAEVGLGWHRSVAGGVRGLRAPRGGETAWLWHNGATAAGTAYAAVDEATGCSVAVLVGGARSADGVGVTLLHDLVRDPRDGAGTIAP